MKEYLPLHHAEEVEAPVESCFYLPMHGVIKETSTTTKLRVVFDASARSQSGMSLSDTLLPGPSLYPKLTIVLNCFRHHSIGFSADVLKMLS